MLLYEPILTKSLLQKKKFIFVTMKKPMETQTRNNKAQT